MTTTISMSSRWLHTLEAGLDSISPLVTEALTVCPTLSKRSQSTLYSYV